MYINTKTWIPINYSLYCDGFVEKHVLIAETLSKIKYFYYHI